MINRTTTVDDVKRRIKESINKIETMFVGVVTGVDYERNRYGVQPILKHTASDGNLIDMPILANCPMCFTKTKDFYIRSPYVIGDVVYVGCSKDSIDESIQSNQPVENRNNGVSKFRLIDGVILGGVMTDEEPVLDSEYTEDFIIQNRQNKDLVVIKKSDGILMKTGVKVDIDSPITNIKGVLNVDGVTNLKSEANITGATTITNVVNTTGMVTTGGGVSITGGQTMTMDGGSIDGIGNITSTGAIVGNTVYATSTKNSL